MPDRHRPPGRNWNTTGEVRHGRSLFWPIAGLLLVTVVVGTAAQILIVDAVMRPLETREQRSRATLAAVQLGTALSALPAHPDPAMVDSMMQHQRDRAGGRLGFIFYRSADDSVYSNPPRRGFMLAPILNGQAVIDTLREGPRRGPFRFEIMARRGVSHAEGGNGEVVIARPPTPGGLMGFFGSRSLLVALPIAALSALAIGLIMMRLLVRRLRGIETLAARVAEGDLSVRIADRSGDEIGRIAERLDRMTGRLNEARDQLAATERQRRQLFADITHELATPLTSIRGYAETLLDPHVIVTPEERARYERGILEESRRLDRLIRDLFELARLEAGATPLVREPLDWAALCANTAERFEPRFRAAGLTLAWRAEVSEAWIEADGHRIEEVLENLLANTLRYVPAKGTVLLSLASARDQYRLTIEDDGPGIAPAELSRVFERFFRGSAPRAAGDDGGSGLGLAIVREIIERHGGAVWAEARVPHGLSITIELPARIAPDPHAVLEPEPVPEPRAARPVVGTRPATG
jgi:signal transduction histidine kinase